MRTTVSLDFKSNLSDPALAQFTLNVLSRIKSNPKFTELQAVAEAELQPACDRYQQSLQEAADRSRTKIAEKKAHRLQLLEVLEKVAGMVFLLPSNSETTVLEAGFKPRQRPSRAEGMPEQVQQLQAGNGSHSGEAILNFKGVPAAVAYGVEWSADGEHWSNGTYATARRAVVSGLPSRQEAWFRVFAIGRQQRKGAPSTAIRFFVL